MAEQQLWGTVGSTPGQMNGGAAAGFALTTLAQAANKTAELPQLKGMAGIEGHPDWSVLQRIPLRVGAGVVIQGFKVRNLVSLGIGQTLETIFPTTEDVPLIVGGVQLAWCEFEVVEQHMAVRITRLA